MTLMSKENAERKLFAIAQNGDWLESFVDIPDLAKMESWYVNRMYLIEPAYKPMGWKPNKFTSSTQGEWKKLKYIGRALGLYPLNQDHIAIIRVVNRFNEL